MQRVIVTAFALSWAIASGVSAIAQGQDAGKARQAEATRYLSTHHIDRFEAIRQVREDLKTNPRNLNDWIILGELAQEVAHDVPANLAPGYYKLAHDAYENALKLDPGNASLKAAARFTQEQEQGAEQFAQSRRRAVQPYLDARRRELSQPGAAPSVRVYSSPLQGMTPTGQPYYYRPYSGDEGQPYTYQQYSRGYSYPEDEGSPAQPRPGQVMTATERAALVKPAAKFAPP